ncbi:PIG-L family deacetylase [Romboutsia lituseburensis]|uniref:PIG-L family deacetylase n=1 Tax=Romboutsia lituseburensis TaxID=1537 RepID=UPI00215A88DE|nr:PIG-L family deacetylase [Romboutsia lituseburensis]MCR8746353.1 PIG-L family deacetylase [Romboutsia lituseburensis]
MIKKNKLIYGIVFLLIVLGLMDTVVKKSTKEDLIKGENQRSFKEHVVFYPQHQDDEVLWGGSAIVEAIKQCGKDNVYVVLVSDGSGVNVFNNHKYKDLTRKEKEALRNVEFKAALKHLGIKEKNIIILADIDNHEGTHFDLMEKVALNFEKKFVSVTHVSHCYKLDNHPMHRQNGKVIHKLYEEGKLKDVMYFLKPKYAEKVDPNKKTTYVVINDKEYNKIKNACKEYQLKNNKDHRYGIGYTSAHSYFDELLLNPKLTSTLYEENK